LIILLDFVKAAMIAASFMNVIWGTIYACEKMDPFTSSDIGGWWRLRVHHIIDRE
jgi:hypothetical protein